MGVRNWMRDAGCGMRDAGFGMRDAGFGIRDARYGIRGAGCGFYQLIADDRLLIIDH